MTLRFTGTPEELKNTLSSILNDDEGEWDFLNENVIRFIRTKGGILNYYLSTGTINFQGKPPEEKKHLEDEVRHLLSSSPISTSDPSPVDSNNEKEEESLLSHTYSPLQSEESTPDPVQDFPSLPTNKIPATTDETSVESDKENWEKYSGSELVLGLVGAVGTDLEKVVDILKKRLMVVGYEVEEIRISKDVIPKIESVDEKQISADNYSRIACMMDAGDAARKKTDNFSILALGAASKISESRKSDDKNSPKHRPRTAYIINSLKHPEEVQRLRGIYPQGFFLFGIHSDARRRNNYLVENLRIEPEKANILIQRDEDEHVPHGQKVTDTFHMSDFFVQLDGQGDQLEKSIWRILDILFGKPHVTPTFDEYAMFLAFSASLRSADLSRQVGAVVAREREILATGANDCPKAGGGLYWPEYDPDKSEIVDKKGGRDYTNPEGDSNKAEQQKIILEIIEKGVIHRLDRDTLQKILEESRIADLTEYGRVVHAEMEALLCCSRNTVNTRKADLYCTTFPCHNCAKHIIAAGISKVIYIEPYPKSKAFEFYSDSIRALKEGEEQGETSGDMVIFVPFVGVGPRRFFDLFSMRLGSGYPLCRKDKDGQEKRLETRRFYYEATNAPSFLS